MILRCYNRALVSTCYESEALLVADFITMMRTRRFPWGIDGYAREFDYTNGRTDVIAHTSHGVLVAFEAKLRSWREALDQAYRNRCFAHVSYVVLPWTTALRAARHEVVFRRRKVGIIAVRPGQCSCILDSTADDPCLGWLTERALAAILTTEEVDGRRRITRACC